MIFRFAFVAACTSAALVALLTVLGGFGFPGYSHTSQFISELGARGAPNEMLIRFLGFLPAGLSLCFFAWAARRSLPRSRLADFGFIGLAVYAAGYVAAAFFPCDLGCRPAHPSLSQAIHNAAGLAGYVLAPLTMLGLAIAARRWPGAAYLTTAGVFAAIASAVGLLTLSPKSPYVGVSQRLVEASVLIWVLLCAQYLRSISKRAA